MIILRGIKSLLAFIWWLIQFIFWLCFYYFIYLIIVQNFHLLVDWVKNLF